MDTYTILQRSDVNIYKAIESLTEAVNLHMQAGWFTAGELKVVGPIPMKVPSQSPIVGEYTDLVWMVMQPMIGSVPDAA